MKEILLITPPFTQLNTPYPATAYLKGFLNTKNIGSLQLDLGIEVILEIFSKQGLEQIFAAANNQDLIKSENAQRIDSLKSNYIFSIQEVILFLQGKSPNSARKIASENFLPRANRFDQIDDLEWAFGNMGIQDKAKYLATLFLEDIGDFIQECIDPHFGFSRYAERLGMSANSFDSLQEELEQSPSYIDEITLKLLEKYMAKNQPKLICFSVPFPGNLYSAFRCTQFIKSKFPSIKVAMGGGFPNTELRSLTDVRVFDYFDFITLDDGELPIELVISNVLNPNPSNPDFNLFKRTYIKKEDEVQFNNFSLRQDYKQKDLGTPDYSDLLLDQYVSVIEIANPMHSLWSDGRWNKLTMAHGCYWGKCTFCDISLSYIKDYEPLTATLLVDRMEEIITQTGERGFHFVDEAAPPSLMKSLALEILKRNLQVSWWTNIRFEKSFTNDLCRLLQKSGCIAVSGGLEVASNRLLKLIDKGVTVEQVAQVCRNFTESGIMIHAYLMYAFPTQTVQETVDSLELVRQLFSLGILQSGFWHQFALTAHSPVGLDPESYGIAPKKNEISFADNDIQFEDQTGIDHNQFSNGLKKSLFNFMHGVGLDFPLQDWFEFEVPQTNIDPTHLLKALDSENQKSMIASSQIVWLNALPSIRKEKNKWHFNFHNNDSIMDLTLMSKHGKWLMQILHSTSIKNQSTTFGKLEKAYEQDLDEFRIFWHSDNLSAIRSFGLLIL